MAVKYGRAFLWYRANIGMNIMDAVMIEWVGPSWSIFGISKSMSGMTESVRIRATLALVFVALEVSLANMYPRVRWPTAYVEVSSVILICCHLRIGGYSDFGCASLMYFCFRV